jgi:hypothetical protein
VDLTAPFQLTGATLLSWGLQLALIARVAAPGAGRIALPRMALPAGLLAVAAGWIWRLVYAFVLASGGFRFWVGDDAVRWLRAWQWSQHPFLTLPGDPWLPGPYALLGSLMWIVGDPMLATRLLASLTCALPLVGVLMLSLALFRSVALGVCAVALLTPQWLHILLGTGAMTEMPVTGLVLIGLSLQIVALRDPTGRNGRAWLGAACFALATSLHLVAWFLVAVAQAGLLIAALRGGEGPPLRRLQRWAGPALLSGAFGIFWLGALWVSTGSPFSQLEQARDTHIFRYGRRGDWLGNSRIHPAALLYSLWSMAPLAIYALARALRRGNPGGPASRGVALGVLAALLLLMLTAASGTNVTPFRTVVPLAAALVPLAVAAIFVERPAPMEGAPRWRAAGSLALAALVLASFTWTQHRKIFASQRLVDVAWTHPRAVLPEGLDLSDTFALGSWMRREFMGHGSLSEANLDQPIRLFVAADHPLHWFEWLFLQYAIGDPGRTASAQRTFQEVPDLRSEVRALLPHQLLISNQPVRSPRVRELFRVGRYAVYEGRRDGDTP